MLSWVELHFQLRGIIRIVEVMKGTMKMIDCQNKIVTQEVSQSLIKNRNRLEENNRLMMKAIRIHIRYPIVGVVKEKRYIVIQEGICIEIMWDSGDNLQGLNF